MKYATLIVVLLLVTQIYGEDTPQEFGIVEYYGDLSKKYEESIKAKNYKTAFNLALEQLDLDPSDAIAFLRLAIASQYYKGNKEHLIDYYALSVSQSNMCEKRVKEISILLIEASLNEGD